MTRLLCKDCLHVSSRLAATHNSLCNHPQNVSVVTGAAVPIPCTVMRNKDHDCGPDGALFRPATELPRERQGM